MVQSLGNMALGRVGKCCRSLIRDSNKGVFLRVVQPGWIESSVEGKRHLLPDDVVGLRNFQQKKLITAHLTAGGKGHFKEQFREKLQGDGLILRNELKQLLHLCESADDIMMARDAIIRYHAENRNMVHSEFKFGPLFMRLCYEFGMDDMAAAALRDERMNGFFDDATSYNITLDLLFLKGAYENAMQILRTMKKQGAHFNKDSQMLLAATCYKLNTEESYKTCIALVEEQQTKGQPIPRRAFYFAIALALRQNDFTVARTWHSQIRTTHSKLCMNLRILILVVSGPVKTALSMLSDALIESSTLVKKPEFSYEVMDLLRLRTQGGPYETEVEEKVKQLEQAGQVTQETFDEMLCNPPLGKRYQKIKIKDKRFSQRTGRLLKVSLLTE